MPTLDGTLSRSVTLKLVTIGALILVLLIPTFMIEGLINDRASLAYEAKSEIMRSWGQPQLVAGPVLLIPWQRSTTLPDGKTHVQSGVIAHLPVDVAMKAAVDTETRYRGLYTVPVFSTQLDVSARFNPPDALALGLSPEHLALDRARLVMGLSDPRTLRSAPVLNVGDAQRAFSAGGRLLDPAIPTIEVAMAELPAGTINDTFSVKTRLTFAGTDQLSFAPVGDSQRVEIDADWPDPSFSGHYLPGERDIDETGFRASWAVTSLGRGYPGTTNNAAGLFAQMDAASFGVTLKPKLNTYDRARRAIHYAVLAITLTFACFFLLDILGRIGLHTVQYVLVGSANCLFFLLLLSLAEHVAFDLAYLISAVASVVMIGGYSASVLRARWRAGLCAAALAALYGFVYMTLGAQTYALLVGSLGLWLVLAAVMYLTRRVDWRAATALPSEVADTLLGASGDNLPPGERV